MSWRVDSIRALRFAAIAAFGVLASGVLATACAVEAGDETAVVEDEAEAEDVGEAAQAVCLASYDPLIQQARSLIAQNCGSISACGGGDTITHNDLQLSNSRYCACYDYMWANRASAPWNALQVIYHEPAGCSWPHIHLEKKNTCGIFHFDLDEGLGGSTGKDCWDDEPNANIDEFFCSAGSRKGTCNDTSTPPACSRAALPVPNDRWRLRIWSNKDMAGDPVDVRYDAPGSGGFSFQWGAGGPSGCAGTDNFSVMFTRSAYFPTEGDYTFTASVDDGVRLFVDGVRIINAWVDQVATHSATAHVTAGWHTLKMNYYENGGGAGASLGWALAGSNPYPSCPCDRDGNYCFHAPSTPGCPMTFPGGYCDPSGDHSYDPDGDFDKGWLEYHDYCM